MALLFDKLGALEQKTFEEFLELCATELTLSAAEAHRRSAAAGSAITFSRESAAALFVSGCRDIIDSQSSSRSDSLLATSIVVEFPTRRPEKYAALVNVIHEALNGGTATENAHVAN